MPDHLTSKQVPSDRLPELKQFHREIVECDNGHESGQMQLTRWAIEQIESLRRDVDYYYALASGRASPPPNCTHPFARLGIDADGVMWCTECFAKPLVIPPPFGEGSVTKSAAPNADPWSMCGKCGERYPSTYAHTCSNVEETSNG